ncbi:type I 3-dehydroquinate dehydratase [Lactococcus nasutitermitis]|uniref:3-dehydroquinate dehydratase n=1 Tax=Lactococcus nasutitermitis TaxID=1652957 RepID=A0ABV9JCE7_9LACT|nr:type I 3-dehydroquinate dehydratase [Lactococcus nasutitermitis]
MKNTQIVVPIMPTNQADIAEISVVDYKDADIIEWRADFLPKEEILAAATQIFEKFKDFKILFTIRTAREGGNIELSVKEYSQLLQEILEFKPDFIDIEYFSYKPALAQLEDYRDKIVLSYHNFQEMPTDLTRRLIQMWQEKTAFVKAAVMPQRECDVLDLLQITRDLTLEYGDNFITMAMGDLGKVTRLSGYLTGSRWTFASLKEASAPGQIALSDVKHILDIFENEN